jgi:hypothetical protein
MIGLVIYLEMFSQETYPEQNTLKTIFPNFRLIKSKNDLFLHMQSVQTVCTYRIF